ARGDAEWVAFGEVPHHWHGLSGEDPSYLFLGRARIPTGERTVSVPDAVHRQPHVGGDSDRIRRCDLSGEASGGRIGLDTETDLSDEVGEGCQRRQLPVREEVS